VAITYIGELTGTAKNTRGMRRYVRKFGFKVDTAAEAKNIYAIGSHASVPVIGSLYPHDSQAWCEDLDIRSPKPFRYWVVTATYTTERTARDENDEPQAKTDPLTEPAQFDWSGEQFQRDAVTDNTGQLIGNAAGDPYDPPEQIDDSRLMCRVEKNVASIPTWLLDYQDAVNSTSFVLDGLPISPEQAKFQRLSLSRKQIRNDTLYRVLSFEIHLRRDGWRLKPLNQGFRDNTGKQIQLPDGTYPTAPVPLKADGSGPLDPPTLATANYGDHEVYVALDFNNLPIT